MDLQRENGRSIIVLIIHQKLNSFSSPNVNRDKMVSLKLPVIKDNLETPICFLYGTSYVLKNVYGQQNDVIVRYNSHFLVALGFFT